MVITDYRGSANVDIATVNDIDGTPMIAYFQDRSYSQHFNVGKLESPYFRSVAGVGYKGDGPYNSGNAPAIYKRWSKMISRCYNDYYQNRGNAYHGVTVHPYFQNFQNFHKWYMENYYELEGEQMELDKDLLYKNNKVYGPDTCCFIPHSINTALVNNSEMRGELPVGVSKAKDGIRFRAYMYQYNKQVHVGIFNTPEEAFEAYRVEKQRYLRELADTCMYKKGGIIFPQFKKVYDALYNYNPEITD